MQGLVAWSWSSFPLFTALAMHQLLTAAMLRRALILYISSCKNCRIPQLSTRNEMSLCKMTGERASHVESRKLFLCKCTPSPFFCYLLPSLFPLPLSVLSPSHLFVLGTYQPERGKRRREGGGVSQHVRQERGGKSERIACGEGTRKAGWEVGSRLKESSLFCFSSICSLPLSTAAHQIGC